MTFMPMTQLWPDLDNVDVWELSIFPRTGRKKGSADFDERIRNRRTALCGN